MSFPDLTVRRAEVRQLQDQLAALMIFAEALDTPVGQAFAQVLAQISDPPAASHHMLHSYGRWFRAIAATGQSWGDYLIQQLLYTDNPLAQAAQHQDIEEMPIALRTAAQQDLAYLQALYQTDLELLARLVQAISNFDQPLPVWSVPPPSQPAPPAIATQLQASSDWPELLPALAQHYHQHGAGTFAQYQAFRWQAGQLTGIAQPDPVRLDQLVGYDQPQHELVANTQRLLLGYPALHVLLYGSRGSGKSSRVKALVNEFGDRGLRLIEVSKADLRDLGDIVDRLRHVPQKFIIFVDDLSFEDDDDAFKALKVVLEGSITARPPNVVVYATSNRRHLIREYFADRPRPSDQDEVHSWDTLQEKLSFADRFGLTLTFTPPDQPTYLQIVQHLARQAQIDLPPAELDARALQWATRHNGRSGRTARQFIDYMQGEAAIAALTS